jgi:CheY-like chemotaxis protein
VRKHRFALLRSSWEKPVIILIVEDNAAIRRLIRRTVQHLASEIHECADGADAIDAYAQYNPDIVFMDIRMPRMDGLAATRLIRKHYPQARIVIVTDYAMDELKSAALEAGAQGYALKDNLCQLEGYIADIDAK